MLQNIRINGYWQNIERDKGYFFKTIKGVWYKTIKGVWYTEKDLEWYLGDLKYELWCCLPDFKNEY